ncbi:hypothetical protein [[Flexibacter] sp. ATCC 35208]|uniref:hypothetical protein n=1 Tax=[Flexibacter] sp. ATCC 35208 TaxID=1936242 RepID=UPI0009CB6076|nr:hypothetical protein [[Flexibacter] sp. ATCC 35208]OMP75191.1 hypothetical protein BW716_31560 [[Flexibacter] sp. ATCC 35208]
MKKVLAIFDGGQYSNGVMELSQHINDNQPILLVGSFLPGIDFTGMSEMYGFGALDIPVHIRVDEETVDENIERFKNYCIHHHIEYRVHKDLSLDAYPIFKKESRFADLLLIGSQEFLGQLALNIPAENLRDALHDAECPVIVVPEYKKEPENIVLAYDGTASSVFAIKMFCYLFPELCNKTTILLHINSNGTMPSSSAIQLLLSAHYPNFQELVMETMQLFEDYIMKVPSPILITGGFGRSGISSAFRSSFANKAMSLFRFPIFIAHL